MVTRRQVLGGAGATLFLPALAGAAEMTGGVCDFVDPFIGTGGHGHTYPGASVPFGMVQLSPDTMNDRWDACGGYHYDSKTIMGFSHTHLSGTGVGDLLDVLVVPRIGPIELRPGTPEKPEGTYRAPFNHTDEAASPGYYRVKLQNSGINAELTATMRAGLHRYTFPTSEGAHFLIDFQHGMQDRVGVDTRVSDAMLRLIGKDTLVGMRRVHQWANGRRIYFALKLSRPFASAQLFTNDHPLTESVDQVRGEALKCVLHYPDAAAAPILVKVGISSVDIDGAIRNLDEDLPDFDFERVRAAARAAWERELSVARIETQNLTDKRIFYTALYHSMMAPTVYSDRDGRYRGMDDQIHTLKPGEENYSTYSLWDTYRALHPLFTLIQSGRVSSLAGGLVRMAEESPAGPPIWPLQACETDCMIGYHSAVVVAEALVKGAPGLDPKRAYAAFRKRAFDDDFHGLALYRARGFIPSDLVDEAASRTLEFAYDDWAMAKMADAAGAHADAKFLRARSQNYRHLFDAKMNFIRPKLSNGRWAEPFDPRALGHDSKKWRDFTESNAWEATFLNQHDLYNYMRLFGGDKAFEAKLDGLFNASSELPADAPPDIAGLVGQYAHGNEPSHHVAYLYAYSGAHYKTQSRVRMLLETMHQAAPDGLAGNEDCGQMSAWYVISSLGLYAVDPVSGVYVFGSPLFDRAEITVGAGKTLVIEAPGNGKGKPYIQSVTWNGKPYKKSWIRHADLIQGGKLVFHMGDRPNTHFGAHLADRPPSFV